MSSHDETIKYIMFTAERQFSDTERFVDIYFSESYDNGESWTSPIAVPRKNMNDKVSRVKPQMIISDNKRIWIFYETIGSINQFLYYVVRNPTSRSFSKEIAVSGITDVNTASVSCITYNNHTTISIFWNSFFNETIRKTYTNNNGAKWNGPVGINLCKFGKVKYTPFGAYQFPYIFMQCQHYKNNTWINTLETSKNFGKTWTSVQLAHPSLPNTFVITKDIKKLPLLAYGGIELYYMKVPGKVFRSHGKPPIGSDYTFLTVTTDRKSVV